MTTLHGTYLQLPAADRFHKDVCTLSLPELILSLGNSALII